MKREVNIDREKHSFSVLGRVDEMRRDKQYCDFLIKVGSEEIHVHRNILAGGSDYFHAMFSHDTKENKSGVVEMLGVDPECAIMCIHHIYGGKVFVPDGKDEEMMHVADLMQLRTLRDAISSMLGEDLDPKSFFVARKIANLYRCKELDKKCEKFAEENFVMISSEDEFGELDKNYIKKVIKSENVKMTEGDKLNAALRWIRHDSERSTSLMEFVKMVELCDVPLEYRRHLIEEESLVNKNPDCVLLISISVFDTINIKSKDHEIRSVMKNGDAIVVFDGISGHLQRFNPKDSSWMKTHEMNAVMKNENFSAVAFKEHIYVLMEKKSVYRLLYSDETAVWERRADMIEEHGWHPPSVVFSGRIYVVAAYAGMKSNAVEMYDPAADQWTKVLKKPEATNGSEVVKHTGFIYSFGGACGDYYMNTAQRYDPVSSTWRNISSISEEKFGAAAVELNGKIFVLGGHTGVRSVSTVEWYDRSTNTWSRLKSMKKNRYLFRAFAVDSDLYAVGGYHTDDSIEKYNVASDKWESVELPNDLKLQIKHSLQITLTS